MNTVFEVSGEDAAKGKPTPHIIMMTPGSLAPSPFGADVNPRATSGEELALRESIAKDGVQVPLTAGRVGGKDKYAVVKGTRRHAIALALGLAEIPVELKEYKSIEDMRQDALRDNLERRQLSIAGRAELANILWRSFDIAEDKKEMAAQRLTPRKRAAIAGGLSEGTLASYRYVLDSGDAELIEKMRAGELSIGKAAGEARKLTEGKGGTGRAASNASADDQMKRLHDSFNDLIRAEKILRETVKRGKVAVKLAKKGRLNDPAALVKQFQAVNQAIAELASNSELAERDGHASTIADSDPFTADIAVLGMALGDGYDAPSAS